MPKGVLYTNSFKTHFSSPSVSCINAPTGHVFTTAESWTVCFHSGLLLKACLASTSAWVVFKWPHLTLASRQPAENHHMTGWWVWPWIQLLCVTCGGENGTNGSHFPVLSEDVALACHFMATHLPPPPLLPCRSATDIGYPSKKNYLKWREIQLAIQCTVDTMNYFE